MNYAHISSLGIVLEVRNVSPQQTLSIGDIKLSAKNAFTAKAMVFTQATESLQKKINLHS